MQPNYQLDCLADSKKPTSFCNSMDISGQKIENIPATAVINSKVIKGT